MILDCETRTDRVSRRVSRLTKQARAANLDPVLVLRMEMESVLTRHGVIEHTTKDENYSLLPENFLEKYLIADNIDKDSKVDDMLHAWSEYLDKSAGTEDIREVIDKLEGELEYENPAPFWPDSSTESDVSDPAPDQEVLQRIKIAAENSSCPRDIEMTLISLGLTF